MLKLRLKKILVPTDFSDLSLSALHYAATMAKHSEAEIILLHVVETYDYNTSLGKVININEALQKAVSEKLEEIKTDNIDLWGIPISVRVVNGKVYKEMRKFIKAEDIDLVVMGTHGTTGDKELSGYILGSNAYRTIHTASCPVITIRQPNDQVKFKDIVVPMDTTKETKQKIGSAIKLAKVFDATIHLISVSSFFEEFKHNLNELSDQLKEVADQMVAEGVTVKTKMIRHDNIAKSVIDYAGKVDADLVMIMVREESKMNDFFLGSSARKVIAQSKVPVLSIKPKH